MSRRCLHADFAVGAKPNVSDVTGSSESAMMVGPASLLIYRRNSSNAESTASLGHPGPFIGVRASLAGVNPNSRARVMMSRRLTRIMRHSRFGRLPRRVGRRIPSAFIRSVIARQSATMTASNPSVSANSGRSGPAAMSVSACSCQKARAKGLAATLAGGGTSIGTRTGRAR